MSTFVGITRERVFSPGRVADDRAILDAVTQCLRARQHTVSVTDADAADWPQPPPGALVFAMCQGAVALERLRAWTQRGLRIVNHPDGILNCQRHRTVEVLTAAKVAFPRSLILDSAGAGEIPAWVDSGDAWLKRGDFHATEASDVVRIDGAGALRTALEQLRARGIPRAVVQQHAPGTVLKFYAVRGRFFSCVPPPDSAPLSKEILHKIDSLGQQAARALGVEVYGGDCVYNASAALTLIDLNDWPSYARCRSDAAREIAAYLETQAATHTRE